MVNRDGGDALFRRSPRWSARRDVDALGRRRRQRARGETERARLAARGARRRGSSPSRATWVSPAPPTRASRGRARRSSCSSTTTPCSRRTTRRASRRGWRWTSGSRRRRGSCSSGRGRRVDTAGLEWNDRGEAVPAPRRRRTLRRRRASPSRSRACRRRRRSTAARRSKPSPRRATAFDDSLLRLLRGRGPLAAPGAAGWRFACDPRAVARHEGSLTGPAHAVPARVLDGAQPLAHALPQLRAPAAGAQPAVLSCARTSRTRGGRAGAASTLPFLVWPRLPFLAFATRRGDPPPRALSARPGRRGRIVPRDPRDHGGHSSPGGTRRRRGAVGALARRAARASRRVRPCASRSSSSTTAAALSPAKVSCALLAGRDGPRQRENRGFGPAANQAAPRRPGDVAPVPEPGHARRRGALLRDRARVRRGSGGRRGRAAADGRRTAMPGAWPAATGAARKRGPGHVPAAAAADARDDARELLLVDHVCAEQPGPAARPLRGAGPRTRRSRSSRPRRPRSPSATDVFARIGGFDERFVPAWYEDVDLCARLGARGTILYCADARFRHRGGDSAAAARLRSLPADLLPQRAALPRGALRPRRARWAIARCSRREWRCACPAAVPARRPAAPRRRRPAPTAACSASPSGARQNDRMSVRRLDHRRLEGRRRGPPVSLGSALAQTGARARRSSSTTPRADESREVGRGSSVRASSAHARERRLRRGDERRDRGDRRDATSWPSIRTAASSRTSPRCWCAGSTRRTADVGSASGRLSGRRARGSPRAACSTPPGSTSPRRAGTSIAVRGSRQRAATCEEEEVAGASGAAGFYRRAALETARISTGYFDADFFLYREDADLAWRLRSLGWREPLRSPGASRRTGAATFPSGAGG